MEVNVGIGFKYLEILLELYAFEKFLNMLEKGLKYLTDQEALKTSSILRKLRDNNDIQIEKYDFTELVNHTMPRFFRNPALVSLWAIYESAIILIASCLQQQKKKSPKLKNYKKKEKMNFLDRANKYFNQVLKVKLYPDDHEEHLKKLMVLRHAIAHCNGRLEDVKGKGRNQIKKWVDTEIGIEIYHGDLLISESFLREIHLIVKGSLSDLIKRVNSTSTVKESA